MVDFLSGAVTLAFVLAGLHFLRFWKKTSDRLFLNFALAFWLFALNQLALSALGLGDERRNFTYLLRVLGFVLILVAVMDKNVFSFRRRRKASSN